MIVVCPKCDIALILLEFNGVEVDYCPRCEGLWLDHGEIEQLIERTGGVAVDPLQEFVEAEGRSETGRSAYLCPRCDRALKEVARRGDDGEELRLDRCPRNDGVWFDKYELLLLLRSLPASMSATGAIALLTDVLGCYTVEAPASCEYINGKMEGDGTT
jgi:Zn-finger nucleic acid-binding protein